ncbi:MAG: ComF family protein [Pseudomonadota bacterium]|nr:ComF family protein [Pseudomonadota bacterium]
MLKLLLSQIKRLIPGCCLLCNQRSNTGLDLCTPCWQKLPWLRHACLQCAHPIEHQSARYCGACLSKPPAYDNTLTPFIYQDAIIPLMAKLKFHRNLSIGRLFGSLLARHIQEREIASLPTLLLPVPLHPRRLRQRGYNQAIIIAEHLSKQLNIPMNRTLCKRLRNTAAQSRTPAKERMQNVNNAFQITFRQPPQHVAIIDDVMTTGATVNALSKALKKAGVARVSVWCCARTAKQ